MMIFDLDPDEDLNIDIVRQGVLDLKKILDDLKLKSYLKTSGGKGYHIVVPFKDKYTYKKYKKFRKISEDITKLLVEKYPDKYTNNVRFKNRDNKIFIDYFRNNKGSTFVCPYSLRIRKKCTVSMPIKWSELYKVKPDDITINDAIRRLKRKDPWKDFFDTKQ
jgi:bifunctional non-homologous end joining protein LigD